MTGWVEILVVAFVFQLSVLPGEKVQFIIAGLSTRYSPWIVVAAAGSAFAGWTVLEILLGEALNRALDPVYLDAITAILFVLFAVQLVRSAPESGERSVSDGSGDPTEIDLSIRGYEVPPYLRGFVPIFLLMAAGEFGDKTQIVTIGLAARYGAHPAIWAGEMLAIIPVSAINALFFHRFARHRFDARKAHFAGAAVFCLFALDAILKISTGFSIWETFIGRLTAIVSALV